MWSQKSKEESSLESNADLLRKPSIQSQLSVSPWPHHLSKGHTCCCHLSEPGWTPDLPQTNIAWHESAHPLSYSFYPQGNPTVPWAALYFCQLKKTNLKKSVSTILHFLRDSQIGYATTLPVRTIIPLLSIFSALPKTKYLPHFPLKSWRQITGTTWPQLSTHFHPLLVSFCSSP